MVEKCGVNERSLRGILDAFLSFDLVIFNKENGTYTAPSYLKEAAAVTPGGFSQLVDVFGSTEKFLRTGTGYETNFSGNIRDNLLILLQIKAAIRFNINFLFF
jgi:hypothetical protein